MSACGEHHSCTRLIYLGSFSGRSGQGTWQTMFNSQDCEVLQGNINLIEAAAKKGVKKFVLVTSIGTGDSKDAPPTQVYDVLKPVLLEKEKAEEALKVRPFFPPSAFPQGKG